MSNSLYGHPDAAQLRKEAGAYMKTLRTDAGITQRELAEKLGLLNYTLISQFEAGKARLPPDKMAAFAQTLGIDRFKLAQRLTQYYDPYLWDMLWGAETAKQQGKADA